MVSEAGSTGPRVVEKRQQFRDAHEGIMRDYPVLQPVTAFDRFHETYVLLQPYLHPGATVVDAGAWPGVLAGCLARLGMDLIAIDKDPRRPIEWSQEVLTREGGIAGVGSSSFTLAEYCEQEGVRCVSSDIERDRLPLADDSVDVVILTEVLEHLWHDPLHTLMEINRILRRGTGVLLLSTPNLCCLRNRINFLGGRIDRVIESPFVSFLKARKVGHLGHCRLYAPSEVEAMLTLLGFDPRLSYARYKQYQATPAETLPRHDPAKFEPGSITVGKRLRKYLRSPSEYISAIRATTIAAIETAVPRFRPQIYVVATKVNDAEFEKNYPKELHELVMSNRLNRSR